MTEKQLVSKIKALTKKINNQGRRPYSYKELMELYHQRSDLLRKHEKSMAEDSRISARKIVAEFLAGKCK